MDSNTVWPGGLPNQAFAQSFDNGQNGEDWEDWLRWDPAADATSPEDGTFHSGSSKNDSPLQDPALPVEGARFGNRLPDDTLAPPLIVEEDTLDFGAASLCGHEPMLFGTGNDGVDSFDFTPNAAMPHMQLQMPKIDTSIPTWDYTASMPSEGVTLSALANGNNQQISTAVPPSATTSTPSLHYSPEASSQNRTSVSSSSGSPHPVPKKRGGRKRKAEAEPEPDEIIEYDEEGNPIKKTSHNVIEKRYRNNLNDKIVELRESVPSLRAMGRTRADESEDLEGLTPAHKHNKATIMAKATEYIKHLEKRNKAMAEEMATLKARLAAVEDAIGKTRDRSSSMSNSPPGNHVRPRQPSGASQNGGQVFLNVPQEQQRYGQPAMPQQYMQQHPQPTYARPANPPAEAQNQPQYVYGRGGGMVNKVMMGAMAGIMVMEGFSEHQSADGDARQLAAIPTALWKRGLSDLPTSPAAFARHATLPLLKIFCVIGALLYLIAPLLTFSPRRKEKTRPPIRQLAHVPSLASPVEVRRKAWLTAMQTVYVPKHFLLEVAAVAGKMSKLSLRRLVGSEAWNALTGMNKEEEAARIKAWDIAIDAQLAGGDAEVSYYRLLLTLMASGTLPDSPTRLMQKAVHFRVFFWEVANAGYGNMVGFKQFTERVGKIYWDSARKLQKELLHAKAQGRPMDNDDGIELLPDHLASLVELDCDDVLGDEMIQRAWNLAWDKPSAYNTTANAARDSVVEDHAIRSPLDAVAAWYANMTVEETLLDAFSEHPSSLDTEYYLGLAVSIAPPASATQIRALAAKAVLSNTHRDSNIIAALEAFPIASPGAGGMNLVNHAPAAPDVHLALTIAKLLSLLSSSATAAAHYRAHTMLASLYTAPDSFTLLTAVAAYRLLRLASSNRDMTLPASHGVEDMAANLRVWIGTFAGRKAGLEHEACGRVVDMCLCATRKFGGWDERDSGYGSAETSPVRTIAGLAAF